MTTTTLTINSYDAVFDTLANAGWPGAFDSSLSSTNNLVYTIGDTELIVTGTGLTTTASGSAGNSGGTVTGISIVLASNPSTVIANISNFSVALSAGEQIQSMNFWSIFAQGTTASVAHGSDVSSLLGFLQFVAQHGTLGSVTVDDGVVPVVTYDVATGATDNGLVLTDLSTGFSISGASTDMSSLLSGGGFNGATGSQIDSKLVSIIITDNAAVQGVSLSATSLFSKIANANGTPYQLQIIDSASNVAADLGFLETMAANGHLAGLSLNGGSVTVTLAEAESDADALYYLGQSVPGANTGYTIADTAANIVTGLDSLNSWLETEPRLSITQTSPLPASVATVEHAETNDQTLISYFYNSIGESFAISDSAANVEANIDQLQAYMNQEQDRQIITSITLTNSGSPVLKLTAAQLSSDTGAISMIEAGDPSAVIVQRSTASDFYGSHTSDILFRDDSTGDTGFYQVNNGANVGWKDVGASSTAYSIVATGDFYGNGTTDILYRDDSTGDTGFYQISNGANVGWHDIGASSTAYSVVGVGDFTNSNTDDVLYRDNLTGDTGFYEIVNGVDTGWHDIGASSTAYSVVGVGDFTDSGTDDVLYRDNSTGDTGFYEIVNGVNTGWHDVGASSTAYSVVGVGDFLGNGTDDILYRDNTTGDTGFYAISNGVNTGWHDIGASSTAYSVVATGDYLGNGTSDIMFRDNTTGDTGFYAISNGVNAGWHDVGASSAAYHVVG